MTNKTPNPWLLAIRIKTLPAAIAPVMIGTAMAFGDGVHHWISAFVALTGALLIQIGTNLANDYFDYVKGADTDERIGPTRVTQAGLVSPKGVFCAMVFVFSLAALACIWLFIRAGWPIIFIGVFSILSGIFYTAGPKPLGYLGLGEVFVLVFFGPVAVAGTYYVQSFEMNAAVILAGLGVGLISCAILAVNNLRDIETDQKYGKKTLAVRMGRDFAKKEYVFLILSASLIPVLIYFVTLDHIYTLLALCVSLLAIPSIHSVYSRADGPSLNNVLAYTGKLLLIYSAIFSAGWIL